MTQRYAEQRRAGHSPAEATNASSGLFLRRIERNGADDEIHGASLPQSIPGRRPANVRESFDDASDAVSSLRRDLGFGTPAWRGNPNVELSMRQHIFAEQKNAHSNVALQNGGSGTMPASGWTANPNPSEQKLAGIYLVPQHRGSIQYDPRRDIVVPGPPGYGGVDLDSLGRRIVDGIGTITDGIKGIFSSGGEADKPANKPTSPDFPGNDPAVAPPGYEWKGRPGSKPGGKDGNYVNPETGESLRPDLSHPPPIGPHWDYRDQDGNWGRIYPDGTREKK